MYIMILLIRTSTDFGTVLARTIVVAIGKEKVIITILLISLFKTIHHERNSHA